MISVRIGNEQRSGDDVTEEWVAQQVNRRRAEGGVCVQVTIHEGDVQFTLLSAGCGVGGGGGRPLRPAEIEFLALWNKLGLGEDGFTGCNLNAFLKQVRRPP